MNINWNKLKHYYYLHRLKNDVENLVTIVPTLKLNAAERDKYLFVYLHGTIGINYGGINYYIPITLYFDLSYPETPPSCFVSPTENMKIKNNHKHVDSKGVIYLPYLSAWTSVKSSLRELISVMSATFSIDPPVYSTKGNILQGSSSYTSFVQIPPTAKKKDNYESLSEKEYYKKSIHEQIIQLWHNTVKPITDCIDRQIALQGKLRMRHSGFNESLETLKKKTEALEADLKSLEETEKSILEQIKKDSTKTFIADDVVQTKDPLSQQILELTATVQAYEDLISKYEDLFQTNCIDLPEFLKLIRNACREQYLSMHLLRKAVQEKRLQTS